MDTVFYFIGLFIFLMAISSVINYFKYFKIKRWVIEYKKIAKENPTPDKFKNLEEYNLFMTYSIFNIIEFFWLLIGIISSNWIIYLLIITAGTITSLIKTPFINKILGFLNQILKTSMILLLIINHFHLHYNLTSLIINYFKAF